MTFIFVTISKTIFSRAIIYLSLHDAARKKVSINIGEEIQFMDLM